MNKILILALLAPLAACAAPTAQQAQILSITCAIDKLVPGAVATAGAIAVITNPETVAAVAAATQVEQLTNAAAQAACDQLIAGSKPVAVAVTPAIPAP